MNKGFTHKTSFFGIIRNMMIVVIPLLLFSICLPLLPSNNMAWGNPIIELVEKNQSDSSKEQNSSKDNPKFELNWNCGAPPNSLSVNSFTEYFNITLEQLSVYQEVSTPPPEQT